MARQGLMGPAGGDLLLFLLSCRLVVGRDVSWRVEVYKLESLLKLNTSTHIFSLFFSSPSVPAFHFFALRAIFSSSLFPPRPSYFKADTGLNQAQSYASSPHIENSSCAHSWSRDFLDQSLFECTVMLDAGVYCPLSVFLDFLFWKDCFSCL